MTAADCRRRIRQQRKALPPQIREAANDQITRRLLSLSAFRRASSIAAYIANDGEADPADTVATARAAGKELLLPVLHPLKLNRLHFSPFDIIDELLPNRFGIAEPVLRINGIVNPRFIDLILVPLVAFDESCHRVGMGAGYYDRTLSFKKFAVAKNPLLIGLAFECQKIDTIAPRPWDIPLDAVITEKTTYWRDRDSRL